MFTIGGVALGDHECPYEGRMPAPGSGDQRWVFASAYGLRGRLKQWVGQDAAEGDIRCYLDDDTMQALQVLANAAQPVTVFHDRAPLGMTMVITTFVPEWNSNVRGGTEVGWDTHIVLVED